jgi:hypothetical protein
MKKDSSPGIALGFIPGHHHCPCGWVSDCLNSGRFQSLEAFDLLQVGRGEFTVSDTRLPSGSRQLTQAHQRLVRTRYRKAADFFLSTNAGPFIHDDFALLMHKVIHCSLRLRIVSEENRSCCLLPQISFKIPSPPTIGNDDRRLDGDYSSGSIGPHSPRPHSPH